MPLNSVISSPSPIISHVIYPPDHGEYSVQWLWPQHIQRAAHVQLCGSGAWGLAMRALRTFIRTAFSLPVRPLKWQYSPITWFKALYIWTDAFEMISFIKSFQCSMMITTVTLAWRRLCCMLTPAKLASAAYRGVSRMRLPRLARG